MREAVRSRSGERGRGARGGLCASLLAAAVACLLLASSASALSQRGHTFSSSFAGQGSGDGQLKEPAGIAVSEATGDIYVVDAGNNRVVEFGPDHKFIRTWGWGVKDGKKEFEICEAGCRAGIGGHRQGQLHGADAIAIDQNTNTALDPSAGDVYVETVTHYEEEVNGHEKEFEDGIIEKYQPNGNFVVGGERIKGWKEPGGSFEYFEEELNGLTVGPDGTLYAYNEEDVIEYTDAVANKFKAFVASEAGGEGRPGIAVDENHILYLGHEAEGRGEPPTVIAKEMIFEELPGKLVGEPLIESLTGEQSSGVAVDEANGDVLVDNVESVGVFDSNGELVERFGAGQLHGGTGVAALRSGEALVADAATGKINVYEPEPPGAPQIDELSVAQITSSSAVLEAQIDPAGLASTYVFRYDTAPVPKAGEPCTGSCVEVPLPAGGIGAAFADVPVSEKITGLTQASLYHYRVIAFNASAPGGVEAAEQKFHTQHAVLGATLPDNRVWELVSPLDKNGAAIEAPRKEGGLIEASENGERVTYVATGAFPGAEGNRAPEVTQLISRRGEAAWSTTDVDTRQVTGQGVAPGSAPEYRFFSADLSNTLVQAFGNKRFENPPLSPEETESTPYVRSAGAECLTPPAPTSCFSPLLTSANVPGETEYEGKKVQREFGGQVNFLQGDATMTHLILQTPNHVALSTEPVGGQGNLWEWVSGQSHLVSILPSGLPASSPQLGARNLNIASAMSSDGSRVIWSTSVGQSVHIYLRDMAKGETVQLDVPEAGGETAPFPKPQFQTASSDGSHIFFTDEQRLTANSTSSYTEGKPDLYDCHVLENETSHKLECKLTDLTVDSHPGQPADVQGLLPGAGSDGNTVYFVANGALGTGSTQGHCLRNEEFGNRGQFRLTALCNLYVERFDNGSQTWGTPQLIAELSSEDEPDWGALVPGSRATLTSRVSTDGNLLTFVSDRSLTGYHNADINSKKPDTEVFLYDAAAEHLTCVSCNPTGARPTGVHNVELSGEGRGRLVDRPRSWSERWLSGNIPTWTHLSLTEAPYPSRMLFDNGRMFFMSAEALVPQDTNGKEDVYEFEPPGVGGCTTESETYGESSGGCVSLISSGTSHNESTFLDASASGNDVFFVTSSRLAGGDTDTSFDVYDATICGQPGSHECLPPPAASPPPCEETQERPCKASATEPGEQFAAPGSSAANGSTQSSVVEVLGSIEKQTPKLTNSQRLTKALKACRKLKNHGKRRACETKARVKYGTRTQKLSAALSACHSRHNHAKQKACETAARKKYRKAKKAGHR